MAAVAALVAARGGLVVANGEALGVRPGLLSGVLLVDLAGAVQALAEDLMLRGWLVAVVGACSLISIGVAVSATLFALLRALSPGMHPLAVLNLSLFGVFPALYALGKHGIWESPAGTLPGTGSGVTSSASR